jgi:pilus assembly protein Flp/PilA
MRFLRDGRIWHISRATALRPMFAVAIAKDPNPLSSDLDVQRYVQRIRRFFGNADGPTAVEYAVMLALIMLTAVSGARTMGCSVNSTLIETTESLSQ